MAKSKDTFMKREKEKKRLQKLQEKKEKKERRKADVGNGKTIEDMIAFVDEDGNLSDNAADPAIKNKIIENL